MNTALTDRLNRILERVTDPAFLSSQGIGSEIACYIFDYPAEEELRVREHIQMMMNRLSTHHSQLQVSELNLFEVALAYLEKRGLLKRALEMQQSKGEAAMLKALKGPMSAERIRDFIASEYQPADLDLLILSGVGSLWPMLRIHGLLNCLHTIMEQTPVVIFYPGIFDGTTLRLFGQLEAGSSQPGQKPYYRAFTLVS